jgi:hypothetical protein
MAMNNVVNLVMCVLFILAYRQGVMHVSFNWGMYIKLSRFRIGKLFKRRSQLFS